MRTRNTCIAAGVVSIPSRGFWFFEGIGAVGQRERRVEHVSIPSRGFWFFEATSCCVIRPRGSRCVSIPSRGFWFFEGEKVTIEGTSTITIESFNPLAGILVF